MNTTARVRAGAHETLRCPWDTVAAGTLEYPGSEGLLLVRALRPWPGHCGEDVFARRSPQRPTTRAFIGALCTRNAEPPFRRPDADCIGCLVYIISDITLATLSHERYGTRRRAADRHVADFYSHLSFHFFTSKLRPAATARKIFRGIIANGYDKIFSARPATLSQDAPGVAVLAVGSRVCML